ncbi:hypothetical protein D9M68_999040 [compost metagenome]
MIVRTGVDDLAIHRIDDSGVELEVLGDEHHQLRHLAARLAGLGALDAAQRTDAVAHRAAYLHQNAAALGGAHGAPGGQRRHRRANGGVHIGLAAVGHLA